MENNISIIKVITEKNGDSSEQMVEVVQSSPMDMLNAIVGIAQSLANQLSEETTTESVLADAVKVAESRSIEMVESESVESTKEEV